MLVLMSSPLVCLWSFANISLVCVMTLLSLSTLCVKHETEDSALFYAFPLSRTCELL